MKDSQRWAWLAVAILAAAVMLLAVGGPAHRAEFAILAGLALLVVFLADRQRKEVARAYGHGTWEVSVNGVVVGAISGENYLRLKREVHRDPHNALGQVCNVVGVASTFLQRQLVAIPVTLFWCTVLLLFVNPGLAATFLEDLRAGATPQEMAASIAALLAFSAVVVVLLAATAVFFGGNLGFSNQYDEAIAERLRRYCKTPATGDVQLFRPISNPGPHIRAVDTTERN